MGSGTAYRVAWHRATEAAPPTRLIASPRSNRHALQGRHVTSPSPPDPTQTLRFTPDYESFHTTSDGTRLRMRLLRPSDRDLLVAGFEKLSPESRYRRFFAAMPRLPERALQRLLDTDGWNHVALGLETIEDVPEGVAVARFFRLPDAPDTAEAAIAVVDHMQRRGLGKLLLAALADAARE